MNMNHLISMIIIWIACLIMWAIISYPVTAQTPKVEVEPTAFLGDGTTLHLNTNTVTLKMVRFRDGTVCVVGSKYGAIALECNISASASPSIYNQHNQ